MWHGRGGRRAASLRAIYNGGPAPADSLVPSYEGPCNMSLLLPERPMNPLSSQPDSMAIDQPFPRLSISHLLVLTLSVAFCLACVAPQIQETLRMPEELFRGRKWYSVGSTVAENLSTGIKVFGLIVLMRQWLRGPAWQLAPGHWLFLATGHVALFNLASGLMLDLEVWFGNHWRTFEVARNAASVGVLLISALVGLRAVRAQHQWRWRICLAVLTVVFLDLAIWHIWRASTLFLSGAGLSIYARHILATWVNLHVCLAAMCLVGMGIDLATRTRRDWLHYVALAAIMLDPISIVLSFGSFVAKWWADLYSHVVG